VRLRRVIIRLLRVAFDPSVTEAERQAFMQRALSLAARHGIGWPDLGIGEGQRRRRRPASAACPRAVRARGAAA